MGIWGIGSFENDDAWDWVTDLERCPDASLVEETVDAVQPERGIPDAIDAELCLVAAETVAAWGGRPAPDLPEEIVEWVERQPALPVSLCARARTGLRQVLASSGLRELWARRGRLADWLGFGLALELRLSDLLRTFRPRRE